MIKTLLELWAKNAHQLDESAVRRECGVRAYGIEYRIMLEGGVAQLPPGRLLDVVGDVDLAWTRIGRLHPDEMSAVKEFYKRGSYRAVRMKLGCSQHASMRLVKDGEVMLTGALLMLW